MIQSFFLTYNSVTLFTITKADRKNQYLQRKNMSIESQVILNHANAFTQTKKQLNETTILKIRRRRVSDRFLSMILRFIAKINRDFHEKGFICLNEYDSKNKTILLCRDCQNIYHQNCGER